MTIIKNWHFKNYKTYPDISRKYISDYINYWRKLYSEILGIGESDGWTNIII